MIKQEFYRWFLHVVRRFLPLGGEIFRFNLKMTEEAATSSSASDIERLVTKYLCISTCHIKNSSTCRL